MPAARPGHGKAARYISGKAPVTAKNASRIEQAKAAQKNTPAPAPAIDMNSQTEEERIAAMFAAGSAQWEQSQQQMAHVRPIFQKGGVKRHVPHDKPIPLGYVCHRCGEKGHWIQDCPTVSFRSCLLAFPLNYVLLLTCLRTMIRISSPRLGSSAPPGFQGHS